MIAEIDTKLHYIPGFCSVQKFLSRKSTEEFVYLYIKFKTYGYFPNLVTDSVNQKQTEKQLNVRFYSVNKEP